MNLLVYYSINAKSKARLGLFHVVAPVLTWLSCDNHSS